MTPTGHSPPSAIAPQSSYSSSDFSFAFPKFGDLPGSTFMSNGSLTRMTSSNGVKPPSRTPSGNIASVTRTGSSGSMANGRSPPATVQSPINQTGCASFSSTPATGFQTSPTSFNGNGMDEFNGLFSPSIIESVARSNSADYQFPTHDGLPSIGKQSQSDSSSSYNASNGNRAHSTSITASPSASSMSHGGMDSSCGTTPEPCADIPEHRKPSEGALNTINEESASKNTMEGKKSFCNDWATACGDTTNPVPRMLSGSDSGPAPPSSVMKSPAADINGIDWMAQQNGGQFDPVLFGDYRDSNDALFNNDFFNEAFLAQDFTTPFNMPESTSPIPPKKDLMQQVEEQQNGGDDEVVPGEQPKQFLTCDKLWLVTSSLRLSTVTKIMQGPRQGFRKSSVWRVRYGQPMLATQVKGQVFGQGGGH